MVNADKRDVDHCNYDGNNNKINRDTVPVINVLVL